MIDHQPRPSDNERNEAALRLRITELEALVAERERVQSALYASEARFQRITANIPGMVFQFVLKSDGSTAFPWVSDGCHDIYGLTPEEIMHDATTLLKIVHPDDFDRFERSVAESAMTLTPWRWEGRINLASGEQKWVQYASRPEQQPDGSILWDGLMMDISDRKQAEEALRLSMAQEEIIRAQDAALRELSTPIIPITDTIVALPLIGAVDSRRAQQVLETLLTGVSENHAEVAILDITGVPVVDTQVADALLQAAQAVKLLGAQVILTGIRPEVAQTIVGLGVDLGGITTRSSLQAGIADALHKG